MSAEPREGSGVQHACGDEPERPAAVELTLHEVNDAVAMAEAAAAFIASRLRTAIEQRGCAVFAVSGGRSPKALLSDLAHHEIDWSRVVVVMVDERAVGSRHPLSNSAAIKDWLLRDNARLADFRAFAPDTDDPSVSPEALAESASAVFPEAGVIDVALLGLGLDGHFASIFPGADGFESLVDPRNPRAYAAVRLSNPPPEAPVDRVTLTLGRLLEARCLVLPLAGVEKRAALERGQRGPDPAWPISLLLQHYRNVLHIWLTRS